MIEEQGYREGRQAFDTYETTLSNHYSDRDLTRETCEDLGAYARMALEANPAELETLATLASRRTIDVCEAGGAARVIPPRTEPLVATYPDQAPVRVIRGAVPPQVAVARARVEAPAEFPDMVSAPVAEPVIEEQAALAVQAADDAASGAARVAEAAVAEAAVRKPPPIMRPGTASMRRSPRSTTRRRLCATCGASRHRRSKAAGGLGPPGEAAGAGMTSPEHGRLAHLSLATPLAQSASWAGSA
jgi:hypothetical protein